MTKTKKCGPKMSLSMAQRAVSRDRYAVVAALVCMFVHTCVCVCTCTCMRVHASVRARCLRVLLNVIWKQATNMESLQTRLATGQLLIFIDIWLVPLLLLLFVCYVSCAVTYAYVRCVRVYILGACVHVSVLGECVLSEIRLWSQHTFSTDFCYKCSICT